MYQHFMITDVENKLSKSLIPLKNLIRKKSLSANADKKKRHSGQIYTYTYTCMILWNIHVCFLISYL